MKSTARKTYVKPTLTKQRTLAEITAAAKSADPTPP